MSAHISFIWSMFLQFCVFLFLLDERIPERKTRKKKNMVYTTELNNFTISVMGSSIFHYKQISFLNFFFSLKQTMGYTKFYGNEFCNLLTPVPRAHVWPVSLSTHLFLLICETSCIQTTGAFTNRSLIFLDISSNPTNGR